MKKPSPKAKKLLRKNILLVVTGSIAAYKVGDLIERLREEGARVTCVMTESAKQFVTPLVLRAISGERVYHEFFATDTPYGVLHTSLAEETDMVLVAPASADFMARLACGMAGDLATCIILATRKPVVLVPAMNDHMYTHPLTQENRAKLQRIGYKFVDPIEGHLVCGKEAIGHVSSPETVVSAAARWLSKK